MIAAKHLFGKPIDAQDGHIGSVHDFYFDHQTWSIRYLVVDTGKWLPGRKVLIVPDAILEAWHGETALPLKLTKEQIKSSPEIDTAGHVSRLAEELLHGHYGWIPYWDVTGMPTASPPPAPAASSENDRLEAAKKEESLSDPRLHSAKDVRGYHIQATDGKIGHVDDLILDDDVGQILFFVIDLEQWLDGKQVLASPRLVSGVDSTTSTIHLEAVRRAIEAGQQYKPAG